MTAVDPSPRALPEIGQKRYAADVKIGWHVRLPEVGWTLVLGVGLVGAGAGDVQLTVRVGFLDEHTEQMDRHERLPSRTPEEQIRWIEAGRSSACGGGPVSRLALDEATKALLADLPRCPTCGGLTGWEDGA